MQASESHSHVLPTAPPMFFLQLSEIDERVTGGQLALTRKVSFEDFAREDVRHIYPTCPLFFVCDSDDKQDEELDVPRRKEDEQYVSWDEEISVVRKKIPNTSAESMVETDHGSEHLNVEQVMNDPKKLAARSNTAEKEVLGSSPRKKQQPHRCWTCGFKAGNDCYGTGARGRDFGDLLGKPQKRFTMRSVRRATGNVLRAAGRCVVGVLLECIGG